MSNRHKINCSVIILLILYTFDIRSIKKLNFFSVNRELDFINAHYTPKIQSIFSEHTKKALNNRNGKFLSKLR